ISLGQLLDLLAAMLVEAELLDDLIHPDRQLVSGYAGQNTVALERFLKLPSHGNRDELGQIPDPVSLDERTRANAVDADGAVRGLEVAEQKRDERAFTGAIRPSQAEHFALFDGERKVVDGAHGTADNGAIGMADSLKFD